jgi:hypothetical protein
MRGFLFPAGVVAAWLVACGAFTGSEASPPATGDDGGVDDGPLLSDDAAPDVTSSDAPTSCWPYAPSNYDPCASGFDQKHPSGPAEIVNGTTTLDTDSANDTIADGAATYALYRFASLTVAAAGTLIVKGARPTLIIVDGDVDVEGSVLVAAAATNVPMECGVRPDVGAPTTNFTAGGGGGGYGTHGGKGGAGPAGGALNGNPTIAPLREGCPGGTSATPEPASNMSKAGASAAAGGPGGGALEISARGRLVVGNTAHVVANGLGGAGGDAHAHGTSLCQTTDNQDCDSGGGGGGSGGAILLEGAEAAVMGLVCAVGGGGGAGGAPSGLTGAGGTTSTSCAVAIGGPMPVAGGSGGTVDVGMDGSGACGSYTSCGGGGGGAGRIRIRSIGAPAITGTVAPPAYTQ